jgi:hypothetical protein
MPDNLSQRDAYRTYSVRLPEGMPEKLRAATGIPLSTYVRHILSIVLQRETARLAAEGRAPAIVEVQDQLADIINEEDLGALQQ